MENERDELAHALLRYGQVLVQAGSGVHGQSMDATMAMKRLRDEGQFAMRLGGALNADPELRLHSLFYVTGSELR